MNSFSISARICMRTAHRRGGERWRTSLVKATRLQLRLTNPSPTVPIGAPFPFPFPSPSACLSLSSSWAVSQRRAAAGKQQGKNFAHKSEKWTLGGIYARTRAHSTSHGHIRGVLRWNCLPRCGRRQQHRCTMENFTSLLE